MKAIISQSTKQVKRFSLILFGILISTVMFSQTISRDFEFKQITANLLKNSDEIISAYKNTIFSDHFYEEEINLEDWMIDLDKFSKSMDSSAIEINENENSTVSSTISESIAFELEFIEEEIELEEWMMDPSCWKCVKEDYLKDQELENWMMDPKSW